MTIDKKKEAMDIKSDITQVELMRNTGRWQEAAHLAHAIVAAQPDRVDAWSLLALILPQLKMLDEADHAAHRALALDPYNPVALRALAVIRIRQQRVEDAAALIQKALVQVPDCPETLMVLGIIRMVEQRLDEADAVFLSVINDAQLAEAHANRALLQLRRNNVAAAIFHGETAVGKKPFLVSAWQLLARLYRQVGDRQKEIKACEHMVRLEPDNAMAVAALGECYRLSGNPMKAIEVLVSAVKKFPSVAIVWANLGIAYQETGFIPDARASYEKALVLDPNLGEVHNNLGALYQQAGDWVLAQSAFGAACRCMPERADFYANRGIVLWQTGNWVEALEAIKISLRAGESPSARGAFVQCVKSLGNIQDSAENRSLIIRAMSEPWCRPMDLVAASINLLKSDRIIRESVGRVMLAWPRRVEKSELFEKNTFREVAAHAVLRCLMETNAVCDLGLEQFLTVVREHLLIDALNTAHEHQPDDLTVTFYCALARQCFINDYVFSLETEETEQVSVLRDEMSDAIQSIGHIPLLKLVALASYFPLCKLADAELLMERVWPDAVSNLLRIQIVEPLEEQGYRSSIKQLTFIENEVSILVQKQYEANPYPKWTKLPITEGNVEIEDYLRQLFPAAPFCSFDTGDSASILIAGCGTGQHSIETAQRFRKSKVLAMDLSITSLSYAARKTRELGLNNIEYAQGDILALNAGGYQFDVIEAIGVLHHLKDPLTGWERLCSLLKPGGFMRLGLYSEVARRDIKSVKHFIAQRGYSSSEGDIRRFRQEILSAVDVEVVRKITYRRDFYEINSCRDLLFHCQEHVFTLPQIKQILRLLGLQFIGFILEAPSIGVSYKSRFPEDDQMGNLDFWAMFENSHPDTFKSMYQFWVQKCA